MGERKMEVFVKFRPRHLNEMEQEAKFEYNTQSPNSI